MSKIDVSKIDVSEIDLSEIDLSEIDLSEINASEIDVSMNGIELQDREFFSAISDGRELNSSAAQVLQCYQLLHKLEQQPHV